MRAKAGERGFRLELRPEALRFEPGGPGLEVGVERGRVVCCSVVNPPRRKPRAAPDGRVVSAKDYFSFYLEMRRRLGLVMAFDELSEEKISAQARLLRVLELELLRITGNFYWLTMASSLLGVPETADLALGDAELVVEIMAGLSDFLSTSYYPEVGEGGRTSGVDFLDSLGDKLAVISEHVDRHEESFLKDPFLLSLTRNIGVIDVDRALDCGLSGPPLRAAGVE